MTGGMKVLVPVDGLPRALGRGAKGVHDLEFAGSPCWEAEDECGASGWRAGTLPAAGPALRQGLRRGAAPSVAGAADVRGAGLWRGGKEGGPGSQEPVGARAGSGDFPGEDV